VEGNVIQYTGRLHRPHPRKRAVRVFDYVDRVMPMLLRMFERRLRGYRAMGYAKGEAQPGTTGDERVVEYDE
jgi:superfamily II DNA or RNA helicase